MEIAIGLLAVAATVLAGAWASDRVGLPTPLVLILVGILGSYLPFVPEVALSPEVVLFGVLPPLLYAAAIQTSLVDFRANRAAIISLSVGLVLFTAVGVATFLWWVLDLPFAVAFAIGAVVGPPDAVAATAIGRRIGLPRRIVSILEGESLVNDATALVSLRTAIAAAGLAAGAVERVTFSAVVLDFLVAAVGGVAVGLAVAAIVELARRWVSNDATFDTVLSFMAPFAAYIPAEELHASGVIAVVTAGLVLGHRSPRSQPGASRLSERINWRSVQFLLENAVFLLIGLQVFYVIDRVRASELSPGTITFATLGSLVIVLVLRPVWIFPFKALANRHDAEQGRWAAATVISWAGMRGVVTLAAAQVLPASTPHRDVLVLIAVVVTVGTLLLQGPTLPALARRLGVRGPDLREDARQTALVMEVAARAALDVLAAETDLDETARVRLRERTEDRVAQLWERVGRRGTDIAETPSEQYRRVRMKMIRAERAAVLDLRDAGEAEHEILRVVLSALDMEETMLDRIEEHDERLRDLPPDFAPADQGADQDPDQAPH